MGIKQWITNGNPCKLYSLSEYALFFGPEYLYIEHTTRLVGMYARSNDDITKKKKARMRVLFRDFVIRMNIRIIISTRHHAIKDIYFNTNNESKL